MAIKIQGIRAYGNGDGGVKIDGNLEVDASDIQAFGNKGHGVEIGEAVNLNARSIQTGFNSGLGVKITEATSSKKSDAIKPRFSWIKEYAKQILLAVVIALVLTVLGLS